MSDLFSERCRDLLTGSYDCPDRIVLNAYYSMGHAPGGFRVWWRRWHEDGDAQLDNAHLMRLAGRFARRVLGQILLGDPMLALAGLAIEHRNPVRLRRGAKTAREPAREPHQVRVI